MGEGSEEGGKAGGGREAGEETEGVGAHRRPDQGKLLGRYQRRSPGFAPELVPGIFPGYLLRQSVPGRACVRGELRGTNRRREAGPGMRLGVCAGKLRRECDPGICSGNLVFGAGEGWGGALRKGVGKINEKTF